jgi:hypothetical protein
MNRILASILCLLPLSGCWTGMPWYAASDAVNVIPDGRYRMVAEEEPGEAGEMLRISRQSDGSLRLDGSGEPFRAIVVPLNPGSGDHRYIVQVEDAPMGARSVLFLLLDNRDGRYRVSALPCGGEVAEIVRGSGGSVSRDPQSATTCEFQDRKTLVEQLRRQAQAERVADIELKRVAE